MGERTANEAAIRAVDAMSALAVAVQSTGMAAETAVSLARTSVDTTNSLRLRESAKLAMHALGYEMADLPVIMPVKPEE